MFKVYFIYVVVAVLVGQSYCYYDLDDEAISWTSRFHTQAGAIEDTPSSDRLCSSPGIMCKNCNTTVICIEIDDGVFEEHVPENCGDDETCLETECVTTFNPHCSEIVTYPFVCDRVGMFPDPFDCRRFHMCSPFNDTTVLKYSTLCDNGYKYNSKSTYCEEPLKNNQCYDSIDEFPVPMCQSNGQITALVENPSMYVICQPYPEAELPGQAGKPELYPFIKLCPRGRIFDVGRLKCIDPQDVTTQEPSTRTWGDE